MTSFNKETDKNRDLFLTEYFLLQMSRNHGNVTAWRLGVIPAELRREYAVMRDVKAVFCARHGNIKGAVLLGCVSVSARRKLSFNRASDKHRVKLKPLCLMDG